MLVNEVSMYWDKALIYLKGEVTKASYDIWIKPLQPYELTDSTFVLIAPDDVNKKTIEHRHKTQIQQIMSALLEEQVDISIVLEDDLNPATSKKKKKVTDSIYGNGLIEKYNFDTFVKGKGNQVAFEASLAVAEAPGKTKYNPLFLYGGVGLGKTHLMYSIANHALMIDPNKKVLYASSEAMMNEFINSIREQKNQAFRDKYRNSDILLIDDIQFLSEKEGTQEEFFHTFNALYNANKQIVISSDKPPSELKTLEKRLTSRFGSGLIVDMSLPDVETRTAILEKKAELNNIDVPPEVMWFIAKNVSSNIRELEGALTKVTAFAKLTDKEITLELAETTLKDMITEHEKPEITVSFIQEIVGHFYGISPEELRSARRTKEISFARHVAMYLSRMLLDMTLADIGAEFKRKDHTSVIHACNKIAEEIEKTDKVKTDVQELEMKIKGDARD